MNVKNLKIEGGVPNNCVAIFNGVAFINAGGSIKNVTLNNIGQTTGCQSGRAIVVENTDASAAAVSRDREQHRLVLQQERDRRARQRRGEDHREHRHGQRADRLHRPERHRRLRGRHGRAGRGQHGQRERLHARQQRGHRDPRHRGGTVTIDRKNTLSGNEVDILNSTCRHQRQEVRTAPNNEGRGGRNTNP